MQQLTTASRIISLLFLALLIVAEWGCGGKKMNVALRDVQTWVCGVDGDNITATLKSNGMLIISGTGAMKNYDVTLWHDIKDSITGVIIEDGVTAIGRGAFGNCTNLMSAIIPNSVTFIGDFAFAGSASITIPGSVVSIGVNALSHTIYINVAEDNPNYSSESGVLFNKEKTLLIQYPQGKQSASYTIPNSVTSIGADAFANSKNLADITFGNKVTAIGEFAFAFCVNLESVTIPSNVTRIGWGAFAHSGLTSVISQNSVPPETVGENPFLDINENACLHVPQSSIAAYRLAEYWRDFKCVEAIED